MRGTRQTPVQRQSPLGTTTTIAPRLCEPLQSNDLDLRRVLTLGLCVWTHEVLLPVDVASSLSASSQPDPTTFKLNPDFHVYSSLEAPTTASYRGGARIREGVRLWHHVLLLLLARQHRENVRAFHRSIYSPGQMPSRQWPKTL
jgi:hypothetical protein